MSTSDEQTVQGGLPSLNLHLDVSEVQSELAVPAASDADPELERRAQDFADRLLTLEPGDSAAGEEAKSAIETMGRSLQQDAARRSAMLKQPIKDLAHNSDDGGPVANALIDLKLQVQDLDPNHLDFSPGWGTRVLGMIPGIGTPLQRYFSKFESAQTTIDAIIRSLELGRDQLKRDNVTLSEDQRAMRELTQKLGSQVELAQLVDQKLQYKLDREVPADDPRHKFIQEELLFPLRQRIMDVQQQLVVNQQGVLSLEIITRNNKELVRGVDRALDVTVGALQVAVTSALALANQKIVLDKITALNRTTSDLIAGTAARLRSQGTEIHTQAASSSLDLEALKSAFADINGAMDEISRFRQEALPQMAHSIVEFDKLAEAGEAAIANMEQAAQARPLLDIE